MSETSIKQFLIEMVRSYRDVQKTLKTDKIEVIETSKGPIKGAQWTSLYGHTYYSFERIPFAKPPINELRFKDPAPIDPWTEVKDCTRMCEVPLQRNFIFSTYKGTEDCLYLNVYTKNLNPSKPLPVIVFIFGGGFQIGDASRDLYGPDYFMSKDIVLITISYRLGAFGFMSFKNKELNIPGNAGLKDQVMGLQWVKENCAKFGGDPNNITLAGQSAGAASVHHLMMVPKLKGLFHKAILSSGSSLCPWTCQPYLNGPHRLAKILGYDGDEKEANIYKFLSKASGASIAKASAKATTTQELCECIQFAFSPTIESYITDQCVIPEDPIKMLKNTWSNEIPIIIGASSFEALYLYPDFIAINDLVLMPDRYLDFAPRDLAKERNSQENKDIGLKILKAYFADGKIKPDSVLNYLDYLGHKVFWHPIYRTALARIEYSPKPTYLFRFDFDSPYQNFMRTIRFGKAIPGVTHGDDAGYLFYSIYGKKLPVDSPEYKTIERLVGIWTSFAEKSDPNCEAIGEVEFKPLSKTDKIHKCLNISNDVSFIKLPESEKLQVWNSLYTREQLY